MKFKCWAVILTVDDQSYMYRTSSYRPTAMRVCSAMKKKYPWANYRVIKMKEVK